MAPQTTSLRAALAYAGNLFSQLQVPLGRSGSDSAPSRLPSSVFEHTNPADSSNAPAGAVAAGLTPYNPLSGSPTCPVDSPISCNNKTATADSCCFVYPGGRLLLTQFWDEEAHVGGAEEDWTLHGLWPDLCDGSFDQFCGMAPKFNNITEVLEQYDQGELVEYMNRYWVAKYGTNDHLWAHEYNKHATCVNTLAPSCYGDAYKPGMEVVDYFARAFALFRTLDTYRALQRAGIEPDAHAKYPLAKIQSALEDFSGSRVILKCGGSRHDLLHEAWYVYFVQGSLQSGEFVPARDSFHGDKGNCAKQVRYLPKKSK
ncbi:ribonuclease T2 family protein [Biscogniauxia sp. FL1348]|nr:ribonuclease T2 family protein [Biscogniauxia sp. FL1348]